MKSKEDQLQSECVRWFRYQYPNIVIFAIPNGGIRNPIEAAKLKATGTLAGVADLFVMWGGNIPNNATDIYLGLFIEMKVGKNQQTPAQKEFEIKAKESGYAYHICRSFDEFKTVVEDYLK